MKSSNIELNLKYNLSLFYTHSINSTHKGNCERFINVFEVQSFRISIRFYTRLLHTDKHYSFVFHSFIFAKENQIIANFIVLKSFVVKFMNSN